MVVAADTEAVEVVAGTAAAAGVAVDIVEVAAAELDVEVAAVEIAAGVGAAAAVVDANGATSQQGGTLQSIYRAVRCASAGPLCFSPISAGHVSDPAILGNHRTSSREPQASRLDRLA